VLLNNGWRRALPGLWGQSGLTQNELHIICITSEFTKAGWKMALFNFEQNFFFLYEVYNLNMTQNSHHFNSLQILF
jgi:hypothetical protein